jgi:GH24 family phage-related lysozyme (muramidase)
MAPNGATKSQGTNSAQTKSANPADINSPAQTARQGQVADLTKLNLCLLCEKKPSYQDPHSLQTSDAQIAVTEFNESGKAGPSLTPYPDPKGSKINSVGYGYHLDSLTKIRLYKSVLNKDGSLSVSAADSLTRNFETTYVHSYIARRITAGMTQGQYDAASDYIYQHGHLPTTFIQAANQHDYLRAGLGLYDPNFPGRTGRDVTEYLNATPETSVWPEE